MQPLELTSTEVDVLRDVVRRYLAEMDHEIRHTDSREFKAMLRERQAELESVLRKLPSKPVLT